MLLCFTNGHLFSDWHHCVACWKVSLCYAANACISLYSISGLNIAVIDMIKRLGPFVNLVLSVSVLHRPFTFNYGVIGILMSAAGCFIGALGSIRLLRVMLFRCFFRRLHFQFLFIWTYIVLCSSSEFLSNRS